MLNTERKQSKEIKPTSTFKKVIRKQELIEEVVILRAEEPKVRYLKLHPLYHQPNATRKIVPELRLCGNWLEKAGFLPCNYVSVTVMDGLLVIRSTTLIERNK